MSVDDKGSGESKEPGAPEERASPPLIPRPAPSRPAAPRPTPGLKALTRGISSSPPPKSLPKPPPPLPGKGSVRSPSPTPSPSQRPPTAPLSAEELSATNLLADESGPIDLSSSFLLAEETGVLKVPAAPKAPPIEELTGSLLLPDEPDPVPAPPDVPRAPEPIEELTGSLLVSDDAPGIPIPAKEATAPVLPKPPAESPSGTNELAPQAHVEPKELRLSSQKPLGAPIDTNRVTPQALASPLAAITSAPIADESPKATHLPAEATTGIDAAASSSATETEQSKEDDSSVPEAAGTEQDVSTPEDSNGFDASNGIAAFGADAPADASEASFSSTDENESARAPDIEPPIAPFDAAEAKHGTISADSTLETPPEALAALLRGPSNDDEDLPTLPGTESTTGSTGQDSSGMAPQTSTSDVAMAPIAPPNHMLVDETHQLGQPASTSRSLRLVGVFGAIFAVVAIAIILATRAPKKEPEPLPVATATAKPSASAPTAPVTPPVRSSIGCARMGDEHVLAPRALVNVGVDIMAGSGSFLLGFAAAPTDAMAIEVSAATGNVLRSARVTESEPIRHVAPAFGANGLAIYTDRVTNAPPFVDRWTVPASAPFTVGMSSATVAWSPFAREAFSSLWKLDAASSTQAVRVAASTVDAEFIVALRRGTTLSIGRLKRAATGLVADGPLTPIAGTEAFVGVPAIAVSGDHILVVWAERNGEAEPWHLQYVVWRRGESLGASRHFLVPSGGLGEEVLSPGVSSLDKDQFLLVWTEGPRSGRQVRAWPIDASGAGVGQAVTISPAGVNGGQGRAAAASGQALVAYLAGAGDPFELRAVSLTCTLGKREE